MCKRVCVGEGEIQTNRQIQRDTNKRQKEEKRAEERETDRYFFSISENSKFLNRIMFKSLFVIFIKERERYLPVAVLPKPVNLELVLGDLLPRVVVVVILQVLVTLYT